jgi:O-antigen ligase
MQGTVITLPASVQRTLSFLPGDWDSGAVADAKFSSEWRFQMWELMLTTDRYIENKILGDGFGMTMLQYQQTQSAGNDPAQLQESYMISGAVHSGPVGTIKFVGYLGLAIFVALLIVVSRTAWKICRRARGTPYFPYALYMGVPAIFGPFNFIFIYGAFEHDLANYLITGGMLKMLDISLDIYESEQKAVEITLPVLASAPVGRRVPAHLQY